VSHGGGVEKCTRKFVGKPKVKRPFGRPRRRREYNIRVRNVDWMHVAQDRDQWRALVDTVISLRIV
jgi:ribosomal protein S30